MKKRWCFTLLAAWIVFGPWLVASRGATAPGTKDSGPVPAALSKPPAPVLEGNPALAVFPLKMTKAQMTVSLPGTVKDAVVGGGGRFLICGLRSLEKLAVFDISAGKIAGYVSLDDPQDCFAAGAEKLMVVNRQTRIVKRYALAGLKQEAAQRIPGEVPVVAVAMGAASRGPLFVACDDNARPQTQISALDPMTFQPSENEITTQLDSSRGPIPSGNVSLRASGDGSVLGVWKDQAFGGIFVVSFSANHLECSNRPQAASYVCPDDVGERIYSGSGLLNSRGEQSDEEDPAGQRGIFAVPAVGGPYFLTVPADNRVMAPPRSPTPAEKPLVSVYLLGEPKPVATLPLDEFQLSQTAGQISRDTLPIYQRLVFIPAAHVIAEIPAARNAVVLHHLDLEEQWHREAPESPLVVSRPPKMVRLGETLRYQIETVSKSGKPVFNLDSGSEGMVLSESGLLEWTPAVLPQSGKASAVISITDSGQSKFHSITVAVQPPEEIVVSADQGPPAGALSGRPVRDVRLTLPARYDNVCAGGGGRYLVFRFNALSKLAVFDTSAAKIIGYVPFDGNCLFAASAEKLVVVNPEKYVIERFDLRTQKLEATQPLPEVGRTGLILAMGAASHGPVFVGAGQGPIGSQSALLDLDTLKPIDCTVPAQSVVIYPQSQVRAAAGGRTFAIWQSNTQQGGPQILVFDNAGQNLVVRKDSQQGGPQILVFDGRELARTRGNAINGWLLPGETGDRIYSQEGGIYSNQLKRLDTSTPVNINPGPAIPAVEGPFWIRVHLKVPGANSGPQSGASADVCLAGETQPLATLSGLSVGDWSGGFSIEKRVYLVPSGKLIALLSQRQDSVVIRRFDPEEELRRSSRDYLVVASVPPGSVAVGQTFQYQIVVKAKNDKVEYRLDSGPAGMTVSPSGLVRWDVTAQPPARAAQAVISIASGNQTLQHEFTVDVRLPGEPIASAQPPLAPGRGTTTPRRSTGGIQPPTPNASGAWELAKVDDHRLRMSAGDAVLTPGLKHQSMLFLQGNHLAVLGADGITISKTHELATTYKRIAERADYYVALVEKPPAIDLLDKKTLATIRRIACKGGKADDLALHPTQPICYVTSIAATLQANGSFVIVDEKSGALRESPNYLGQWIEVDAAGQRLVAAGMFSRVVGQDLVPLPRSGPAAPAPKPGARTSPKAAPSAGTRVVTRRESIEALLVYDLHDDGSAHPADLVIRAAGRSTGLRMSPDGMRATFLKTGTVNREALDLDALDEKPVTYAGGNGIVLDLAYHPVLPLAACVGADFSIVCDRETGKLQADALKSAAADLQSARFQHVWFSADGKGLLFDMIAAGGEHLLYRAALNLSPADMNKVGNRLANMASLGRELLAEQSPAAGKGSVPLAEIDAFRGDRGREMSPADIGRAYTDAVVIVQNERGSGTGFVVGKSGYVLTCAHCVRQAETNSVSYRASEGGKATMKSVPAKVLYCDNHTDMALLKIDGVGPLPAVCLAVGEKVESGERVTIIGNPGLGGKILDYTMTEGIVSNARRELRHQTLIQTSAAVNPGSSGGPMFNSRGLVIGMVDLKGDIENAGFAVRVEELGQFLATAVNASGPAAAIQRKWLDAEGQHSTDAKYLGVRDGAVQLRRADGNETAVPLSKLSPQDQAFVRLLQPNTPGAP